MPVTTVKIYEVNNSYVTNGSTSAILNIFEMTIDDNDNRLHADEAADPGSSQIITTDAGTVTDYDFIYDDTSVINGQTVTIKTFQLTIDGVVRSFVMEDDWSGLGLIDAEVGDTVNLTSFTNYTTILYSSLACFVEGTMIDTPSGPKPVERLAPGDLVITLDNGAKPIRWTGTTRVSEQSLASNPSLRPIRIEANAFGAGTPQRPVDLSPQHRVLVAGWEVELTSGLERAFAPATHLLNGTTVVPAPWKGGITYCHIMFDTHEIVTSEGLPTESFHVGDTIRDGMDKDQLREILALFPDLETESNSRVLAAPQLSRQEAAVLH